MVFLSRFRSVWAVRLREGDIIIEVNRRSIAYRKAFNSATSASAVGSRSISALSVIRRDVEY